MKRIDKVIRILEDAERDFRLEPNDDRNNQSGICRYIRWHPLLVSLTERTQNWYRDTILESLDCSTYWFMGGLSQEAAWNFKEPGYNTERADWCKMTLEKIQKEGL